MAEEMERKRNIPLAYLTLARLYKKDGQYAKGLGAAIKAIDLDTNDFWAFELSGTLRAKLGDLSGGLADLNRSLEINPHPQSAIYLERGIIYLMLGDNVNSQKDFDKYLEAFPNGRDTLEKRIEEANKKLSETSVGVVECDDYIRKMRSCLFAHTPIASFTTLNASIDSMAQAWKSAVSTPESKAALAAACSQARQTARASLSGYDCEW